jgi:uncharacterized phosphosugar-binding protein
MAMTEPITETGAWVRLQTDRDEKGLIYTCKKGHSWLITKAEVAARIGGAVLVPNLCPQCQQDPQTEVSTNGV